MQLDWGEEEEMIDLVDLLLTYFTPLSAWSWMLFPCAGLGDTPIYLIQEGRGRKVVRYARKMIENTKSRAQPSELL